MCSPLRLNVLTSLKRFWLLNQQHQRQSYPRWVYDIWMRENYLLPHRTYCNKTIQRPLLRAWDHTRLATFFLYIYWTLLRSYSIKRVQHLPTPSIKWTLTEGIQTSLPKHSQANTITMVRLNLFVQNCSSDLFKAPNESWGITLKLFMFMFSNREKVWVHSLSESDCKSEQLWGFAPPTWPWPQTEPSVLHYTSMVEFINDEARPVREQQPLTGAIWDHMGPATLMDVVCFMLPFTPSTSSVQATNLWHRAVTLPFPLKQTHKAWQWQHVSGAPINAYSTLG